MVGVGVRVRDNDRVWFRVRVECNYINRGVHKVWGSVGLYQNLWHMADPLLGLVSCYDALCRLEPVAILVLPIQVRAPQEVGLGLGIAPHL